MTAEPDAYLPGFGTSWSLDCRPLLAPGNPDRDLLGNPHTSNGHPEDGGVSEEPPGLWN